MSMDRRTALARLLTITGTLAIGADAFLSGCSRATPARKRAFTPADIALMDEIGDTIVPTTDTPGAKAVGIGAVMAAMARSTMASAPSTKRVGARQVRRSCPRRRTSGRHC
jgi:hypothetical protein